jgi:hypothetical protein
MEKKLKYRVHAVPSERHEVHPEVRYVIQKKSVFGMWLTISDEMVNERYANEVCNTYNKYNA